MLSILYIVPYVPNPIRTRPYNLIRALGRLGHDVTVLTLTTDRAEEEDAHALRKDASRVITLPLTQRRSLANSLSALATDKPLQSVFCWSPAMAGRLRQMLEKERFDIVHVEHLRGARYGLLAKTVFAAAGQRTPVVWDSVDSISHLFRQASVSSTSRFGRWVTRLELPRTERYEGRLIGEFDAVLATSPVDRDALVQLAASASGGKANVHVLPNGVDLEAFKPNPDVEREPATLVLSGKMSYHANVSMAVYLVRDIMPLVWSSRPDARVMVVGKNPPAEVQAMAGDSRVTVTGAVGEIGPYLNRATLAVAPIIYSAGIQNKILEAMACATPVVTTPQSLGGLTTRASEHLIVGEDTQGLAAAILELLNDPHKRATVGAAARAFVEAHHDWQSIGTGLASLYMTVQSPAYKPVETELSNLKFGVEW